MAKNKIEPEKNMPEKALNIGSVSAAIFRNAVGYEGHEILIRKIQLAKSFKNKEDQWVKQKIYLDERDVLRAILLLQMCAQYAAENPVVNKGAVIGDDGEVEISGADEGYSGEN